MVSLISLFDLTFLEEHADDKALKLFCTRITQLVEKPAAVCVYIKDIETVQNYLSEYKIPIATVINFPHGLFQLDKVQSQIRQALSLNVSELDIVLPYNDWLSHHDLNSIDYFISHCKEVSGPNVILKFILETGAFNTVDEIECLALRLCQLDIDFIKTSTGKRVPGATVLAVQAILNMLKIHFDNTAQKIGLKISGGVRSYAQVNQYLSLIQETLGAAWIAPTVLRFGSSRFPNEMPQS